MRSLKPRVLSIQPSHQHPPIYAGPMTLTTGQPLANSSLPLILTGVAVLEVASGTGRVVLVVPGVTVGSQGLPPQLMRLTIGVPTGSLSHLLKRSVVVLASGMALVHAVVLSLALPPRLTRIQPGLGVSSSHLTHLQGLRAGALVSARILGLVTLRIGGARGRLKTSLFLPAAVVPVRGRSSLCSQGASQLIRQMTARQLMGKRRITLLVQHAQGSKS